MQFVVRIEGHELISSWKHGILDDTWALLYYKFVPDITSWESQPKGKSHVKHSSLNGPDIVQILQDIHPKSQ
jgi:hypothetical protein